VQTFTYTVTDGKTGGTASSTASVRVDDNPTITQSDYLVSKSAWTIAGTAGPGANVTVTTKNSAGVVTTIGTVTADTRGAWKLAPVLTIDATSTILDLVSTQRGVTSRAIARK